MRRFLATVLMLAIAATAAAWAFGKFKSAPAATVAEQVTGGYIGQEGPPRDKVIVFVHGVTGSADETWTYEDARARRKVYWPELMRHAPGQRNFYKDYDIYVVNYPTTLTQRDPSLVDLARGLSERLIHAGVLPREPGQGGRRAKEIIFIAHSMGNLVVRVAMTMDGRFADPSINVPLILSIAAPSAGSSAAEFANLWSKNPQYRAMLNIRNNPFLQLLNGIWRHNPPGDTEIACAYEDKPMPGTAYKVVDTPSATAVCSRKEVRGFKEDHSSIVKPASEEAAIHQWVTAQIRQERTARRTQAPERWQSRTVVVGGKDFMESNVLAAIMAFAINPKFREPCAAGDVKCFNVRPKYHIGGRDRTYEEFLRGEIDLYAEYTGTLLANFPDLSFGLSLDEARDPALHDPARLNQMFLARRHLNRFEALPRFALKSDYRLILRRARAVELGLPLDRGAATISALAERSYGKPLRFSSTPDFFYRPDGVRGMREYYAFVHDGESRKFDFSAIAYTLHDDKYRELRDNKTDVVDAYLTDAELFDERQQLFIEIMDDKGFFPSYDALPLVNRDLLRLHAPLRAALSRFAGRVTTREIAGVLAEAKRRGIKSEDLKDTAHAPEKRRAFEALVREHLLQWGLLAAE